jgi:hypothetical protein
MDEGGIEALDKPSLTYKSLETATLGPEPNAEQGQLSVDRRIVLPARSQFVLVLV